MARPKAKEEQQQPAIKQWLSQEFHDPARYAANMVRCTCLFGIGSRRVDRLAVVGLGCGP